MKFYTGDGISLPWKSFIGRTDLRTAFAERVGFNYVYDEQDGGFYWQNTRKKSEDLSDWAWVIEGRRGFGKSAFAAWCSHMQSMPQTETQFLVALANPDLCANPRIAPLEAALHRLRGQVLDRLDRVDNGIDFGWWSPGEVLRVIAEEAYEKAKIPPRCIVFILDNISILPAEEGEGHYQERKRLGDVEREVAALIAEVSRLRRDNQRPVIGVMALAYPGFYQRVGYALRSRYVHYDLLTPFSPVEVQTFLHLYVGPDASMANLLGKYSGGIPDLVQSITKQSVERNRNADDITAGDIENAINAPTEELLSRLSEQLLDRRIDAKRVYSSYSSVLMHLKEPIYPSEERKIVQLAADAGKSEKDIREFLRYMESLDIIETTKSGKTVFSEAVWLNMDKCIRYILKTA